MDRPSYLPDGNQAVVAQRLTKSYSDSARPAVDALSMTVPRGAVYALLGVNGAGKTTTINMLLGLLPPDSGEISLLGYNTARDLRKALPFVGAMLDSPSVYGHLTARENLELARVLTRQSPRRVLECLELVGLADVSNKVARTLSTGMRQRLGLAAAFLRSPDLLVLDEPTSRLDPISALAIRRLIQEYSHVEKRTILMSSHLLHEVEELAAHVGIIHEGRMLYEGRLDALMDGDADVIALRIDDPDRGVEVLAREGWIVCARHGELIRVRGGHHDSAHLNHVLVSAGVKVHHLAAETGSLEAAFVRLVDGRPTT